MVKDLTDFDVFPFRWSCRYCSRPYPLADFFDAKDIYKHFESPLLIADLRKITILDSKTVDKITQLYNGDTCAFVTKMNGKCINPKCNAELGLVVWIDIFVEDKSDTDVYITVSNYIILDGDIEVYSQPGFYRGIDIAAGLQDLYLRWWYLGGDISVFCPYIGLEEIRYFDNTGLSILKTVNVQRRNPFRRIVTRRINYNFGIPVSFMEKVSDYLNNTDDAEWIKTYQKGMGLSFIFKGTLYGVETSKSKDKRMSDKSFELAHYFHAKMYGALLPYNAEMVITSYNYIEAEAMQLESLAFVEASKEDFEHQVQIFEKDQHMKIKVLSLDKIK